MDLRRIDLVARALGAAASRRVALGGLLAALSATAPAPVSDAKKRRKRCKPKCPTGQKCKKRKCICTDGGIVCGPACCTGGQVCQDGACQSAQTWSHIASFGQQGSSTGPTDGVLRDPSGVAVDETGTTVLVTSVYGDRVLVWRKQAAGWSHVASFGTYGEATAPTDGLMGGPWGVAVDRGGTTAWVTDWVNSRITIWERRQDAWAHVASLGTTGFASGQTDGMLYRPMELRVDAAATTLLAVDWWNKRVVEWQKQPSGWKHVASLGTAGDATGPTDGRVGDPQGVGLDADGTTALIGDAANHRVTVWRKSGQSGAWSHVDSFGSEGTANGASQGDGLFSGIVSVALSPDGATAWVTDTGNDRVVIWKAGAAGWSHVASFGRLGNETGESQTDGTFWSPSGIAVDPAGTQAWIADGFTDRVVVWTGE